MFGTLFNYFLIPGNHFSCEECRIELLEYKTVGATADFEPFHYFVNKNFDKAKPTFVYSHGNRKFDFDPVPNLLSIGNVICFPFLGYDAHINRKNKTLQGLIDQLRVTIEDAEKQLLKTDSYYGGDYKREKHLHLVGRSLGTLPQTKLAASEEKKGKNFAGVYNMVCPVNLQVAAKSLIASYSYYIAGIIVACIALLSASAIGIWELINKTCLKESSQFKKNHLLIDLYIAIGVSAIVCVLLAIAYFEAKNIGINIKKTCNH